MARGRRQAAPLLPAALRALDAKMASEPRFPTASSSSGLRRRCHRRHPQPEPAAPSPLPEFAHGGHSKPTSDSRSTPGVISSQPRRSAPSRGRRSHRGAGPVRRHPMTHRGIRRTVRSADTSEGRRMRKRLGWIGGVVVGAIAVAGALTTVHAQSGVSGSDMSRAVDFSGPCEVTATLEQRHHQPAFPRHVRPRERDGVGAAHRLPRDRRGDRLCRAAAVRAAPLNAAEPPRHASAPDAPRLAVVGVRR